MTTASAKLETADNAMNRDWFNIGQNQFINAIKRYSETEQDSLEWLWGYLHTGLNGSKAALCREMNLDAEIITRIFFGLFDDSLDAFCEIIQGMKMRVEKKMPLIHTIVTRRVTEALDYARDYCSFVIIQGPTGRSKSHTAEHWALNNNHGRSRYIRLSSACSRTTLVNMIARNCGIGTTNKKTADLEDRIRRAFTPRNILIVDEAGFIMPRSGSSTGAIEFIRDLYDMCGCGVVLIFTDVYIEEMKNGRLKAYFEQFIGRIDFEVSIPKDVFREECDAVVKAFNPKPSKKMLDLALDLARRRHGKLRPLFKDLKRACIFAAEDNRKAPEYDDLATAARWRMSGASWPTD